MLIPLPGRPGVSAAGAQNATQGHTFLSQREVAPFASTSAPAARELGLLLSGPRRDTEDVNAVTAVVSCPHNMSNVCGPCVQAHVRVNPLCLFTFWNHGAAVRVY